MEEFAGLNLQAAGIKGASENLDGIIAEHQAGAEAARGEAALLKAILAGQVIIHYMLCTRCGEAGSVMAWVGCTKSVGDGHGRRLTMVCQDVVT
jgi:hypothetical protein